MKLHDKKFYAKEFDEDIYRKVQIERHQEKASKKRDKGHYLNCCDHLIDLVSNGSEMICLGTRNNHERDVFKNGLSSKEVSVYSLDISPNSNADYVMDFNSFPEEWNNKWDIVFSNSLDHSVDATKSFYNWLDVVKVGGIMIIGFYLGDVVVGQADCCSFDNDTVESFMFNNDAFEFVESFNNGYKYYIIKKGVSGITEAQ